MDPALAISFLAEKKWFTTADRIELPNYSVRFPLTPRPLPVLRTSRGDVEPLSSRLPTPGGVGAHVGVAVVQRQSQPSRAPRVRRPPTRRVARCLTHVDGVDQ